MSTLARTALTFIEPMSPCLTIEVPEGVRWLHELKYDGYRTELIVERRETRAFTRRGYDWTDTYSSLVKATRDLACDIAILDGEVIVQDACGVADFYQLRRELDTLASEAASAPAGRRLEARVAGTGRDGGPACATVKLLAPWRPLPV
jgi:ATP-dependent DNA ligase